MLLRRCIFGNHSGSLKPKERLPMSLARRALVAPLIALLLLGGCDAKNSGSYGCGISAVAGQSLLLEEFTRPGKTLSVPPANLPATLPVRVALGPALRAVAGRADSFAVIGIEGALPADRKSTRLNSSHSQIS